MVHAVLGVYGNNDCPRGLECTASLAREVGCTGHGPAFVDLAEAIEARAEDLLSPGTPTIWRLGIKVSLLYEAKSLDDAKIVMDPMLSWASVRK